ncbi:hypothetical protein HXX76_014092 [Chlamydomonas incerta]|uniref:Uncharacterized protein n=1 Tax=Chlamydomonas incerta TaxID=51695 RepID=A0A835VTH4_CHLIN|nr:hypothetical protein HXX76_014092 [Chlamydomonas incerta]|eukprot:KAG2424934.1 hypothetical protein HXX76_014092 [Chlamydomonas incerta]
MDGVTSYENRYWLQITKRGRGGKAPLSRLVCPDDPKPLEPATQGSTPEVPKPPSSTATSPATPSSYVSALEAKVNYVDNDRLNGCVVSSPQEAMAILTRNQQAGPATVPWIRKPRVRCFIGDAFNADTFLDHHSDAMYALYCDVTTLLQKNMVHTEPSYVDFADSVISSLVVTRADADDGLYAGNPYAPDEDLPLEMMHGA